MIYFLQSIYIILFFQCSPTQNAQKTKDSHDNSYKICYTGSTKSKFLYDLLTHAEDLVLQTNTFSFRPYEFIWNRRLSFNKLMFYVTVPALGMLKKEKKNLQIGQFSLQYDGKEF